MEENNLFDYFGLREEIEKLHLDEGRVFEGVKCVACKRLVVSHNIDKKDGTKHILLNRKIMYGPVIIIALMELLLVLSLCVTNVFVIK